MSRIDPIAAQHQLILECLGVLQLIADRMEAGDFVDPQDVATVLEFLRDVGCECLDGTEKLLLRPALQRTKQRELAERLQTALACHQAVRPLFDNAAADVGFRKFFVLHAHLLTKLVRDLIQEEDQYFLWEVAGLLNDPDGLTKIKEFLDHEQQVHAIAVQKGPAVNRLSAKYAYPQASASPS
jgi:hemerythrin-like domain-containing protein